MKSLAFLIIFVIILSGVYLAILRFVKVKVIYCQSQFGPCNANLEERIKVFEGENLYLAKKNIKNLLSSDDFIYDYAIYFKLPPRLEVNVVERKAKFALTNRNLSGFALSDKTGLIVRIEGTTNLPYIVADEQIPSVGEKVPEDKLFALKVIYDIFALYQTKSGTVENGSLLVKLIEGPTVVFPLKGDRQALLGALELILANLNEQGEAIRINENIQDLSKVSIIDLRFKNPVLR